MTSTPTRSRLPLLTFCAAALLGALPVDAAPPSGAKHSPDAKPQPSLSAPTVTDSGVVLGQELRFEKGKGRAINLTVKHPDNWSEEPSIFYNSRKLVDVPQNAQGAAKPSARIKIYTEQRLDHADALRQVREFAQGIGAGSKDFLLINGWPALQFSYVTTRPQPEHGPRFEDTEVLRIATLVAAGDVLVRLDG